MLHRLMALGLCVCLASCATTNMTALRDPSALGLTFSNVLVVAPFGDLDARITAEETFVDRLASYGVAGIPSYAVMPPTNEYSDAEFLQRLDASGADSILLVSITDAYQEDVEVVAPSSTTTGRASMYGTVVRYSERTEYDPGYYVTKPRVRSELRLLDASSGDTVWLATSFTRGNGLAEFEDVMGSLANTAGSQLREEGLIAQ